MEPELKKVATMQEPVTAGLEKNREALTELLASELGDAYYCTRIWSAWGYGTMSQDDFEPAEERAGEIADSIIRALADLKSERRK